MNTGANKLMSFIYGFIIYILFGIVFSLLSALFVFITGFPVVTAILGFLPFGGKLGLWIAIALAAYAAKLISYFILDAISKYSYETNRLALRIAGILIVIFQVYKGISAFSSGGIYSTHIIAALIAATMIFV